MLDYTNRGLNNTSYPARTEFNNCFIIFRKYFKLSLNAWFVSKNAAANNGTAQNCSETLISQLDYEKDNILQTIVRIQCQPIYD